MKVSLYLIRYRFFCGLFVFLLSGNMINIFAQSNQYLHFDGEDDHIVVENGSAIIANSNAITMAGWFKTDALGYGQGMMGIRYTNAQFYMIQLDNGSLECRFQNSNGGTYDIQAGAGTVLAGQWMHFAFVYDGSKTYLYRNGQLHGSKNASGTIAVEHAPLIIGRNLFSTAAFYYGGAADEVSLWTKALTQEEVQEMMTNELNGSEEGLELYYKFDQGFPDGDNTSIKNLVSNGGKQNINPPLLNFSLTGSTSNFSGQLDAGKQVISFPTIPAKLTTDQPFELNALSSSGLEVGYIIMSGPASVSDNTITLTGESGMVEVLAYQSGNATYEEAGPVTQTFEVLDITTYVPTVDSRNPYKDALYFVDTLVPIQLSAFVEIGHPELFDVAEVQFIIGDDIIQTQEFEKGYYAGSWQPDDYSTYTLTVRAYNNHGYFHDEKIGFTVYEGAVEQKLSAFSDLWLHTYESTHHTSADLPCFLGAYDKLTATFSVECPPLGCDDWDAVSKIYAKGYTGEWVEIIRYVTPYGVACSHTIDLTDFQSILKGKTEFYIDYAASTVAKGFEFNLDIHYQPGKPEYLYSTIQKLWNEEYPFGDPGNLQPVETLTIDIPDNAQKAKIKLISTGHGWGNNNTNNAAEFSENTHHIWVNNEQKYEQHNWKICDPNPQSCQPQYGTWYHPRAGWCPGATADWFEYDASEYLTDNSVELQYRFDEGYTDFCHPNNPDCVNGQTCPSCNDGYNPVLLVTSSMIFYTNESPFVESIVGINDKTTDKDNETFVILPNPANEAIRIIFKQTDANRKGQFKIYNVTGQLVYNENITAGMSTLNIDIKDWAKGTYLLKLETENGNWVTDKLIVY